MCCAEKVSELINRPVVRLFGTRVGGARGNMVTKGVYLKFPATTSREWSLRDHWDLGTHRGRKECLSEVSRPDLMSTVPDLDQTTHGIEEEDALGVFLFQRLKASHLRPKYRVLNGSHYAQL